MSLVPRFETPRNTGKELVAGSHGPKLGDGLVPVSGGEELFKDVKVLPKCCWIKTMVHDHEYFLMLCREEFFSVHDQGLFDPLAWPKTNNFNRHVTIRTNRPCLKDKLQQQSNGRPLEVDVCSYPC